MRCLRSLPPSLLWRGESRACPSKTPSEIAAFRSLALRVTPDTLIPRPENELLVELVIAAQRGGKGTAVGAGTGTSAVTLALAAVSTFEGIIATDISESALAVAKARPQAIPEGGRARLDFRAGDLLAPVAGLEVEAVVSNPPWTSPAELAELRPFVRS